MSEYKILNRVMLFLIVIYGCVIPRDAQQVTESFLGQIPW
jgi:hypothetical protein